MLAVVKEAGAFKARFGVAVLAGSRGLDIGDFLLDLWINVPANTVIQEDFLEGIPGNWTLIDEDGDSFDWESFDEDGHDDSYCVRSGSYISGVGALTPDNYLVLPKIDVLNDEYFLKFWVKPFSDYFFAEHYKVKISTITDTIFIENTGTADLHLSDISISNNAFVMDYDIYTHGLNYVFGEVIDSVGIISLTRLKPQYDLTDKKEDLYKKRTLTEAIHELGHIFGLKHCNNPNCVMHFSDSIKDTDKKGFNLCNRCKNLIKKRDLLH